MKNLVLAITTSLVVCIQYTAVIAQVDRDYGFYKTKEDLQAGVVTFVGKDLNYKSGKIIWTDSSGVVHKVKHKNLHEYGCAVKIPNQGIGILYRDKWFLKCIVNGEISLFTNWAFYPEWNKDCVVESFTVSSEGDKMYVSKGEYWELVNVRSHLFELIKDEKEILNEAKKSKSPYTASIYMDYIQFSQQYNLKKGKSKCTSAIKNP